MPKVYELRDEEQAVLSWHPTLADAEKDQKWWADDGGTETTIHPHEYVATRKGVADLLNRTSKAN